MKAKVPPTPLRLVTTGPGGDATAAGGDHADRLEALFVESLPVIEGVVRYIAHRHKLSAADADEFGSEARFKLMANGYEVFQKFQQRSSLRTYLTIVIQRIYLDYRNHLWGKWRPSAEARRLGPAAIRLETLMMRDGLGFEQACEHMLTNERAEVSQEALVEIAIRLPLRPRRAMVGEEVLDQLPAADSGLDDHVVAAERQAVARRMSAALAITIAALADQDRVILRLRFQEDMSVVDIARALHLEQKPLYRRFKALLQQLQEALQAAGIDAAEAFDIVSRKDVDISLALLAGPAAAGSSPAVPGPAGA